MERADGGLCRAVHAGLPDPLCGLVRRCRIRGLTRMRDLVRPGGVLVVVGLARGGMPGDLPHDLAGALLRTVKGRWEHPFPVVWPPPVTYAQTRALAAGILPAPATASPGVNRDTGRPENPAWPRTRRRHLSLNSWQRGPACP